MVSEEKARSQSLCEEVEPTCSLLYGRSWCFYWETRPEVLSGFPFATMCAQSFIHMCSVQNLEIIAPLWSGPSTNSARAKKGSLFGILNTTKTVCGWDMTANRKDFRLYFSRALAGLLSTIADDFFCCKHIDISMSMIPHRIYKGHGTPWLFSVPVLLRCLLFLGRSRLLKANLLQPLKDVETLNTRLDSLVRHGRIGLLLYFGFCATPNWFLFRDLLCYTDDSDR